MDLGTLLHHRLNILLPLVVSVKFATMETRIPGSGKIENYSD